MLRYSEHPGEQYLFQKDKKGRVFPVCTGMNRPPQNLKNSPQSVPRVYGDEPALQGFNGFGPGCSPCVRG